MGKKKMKEITQNRVQLYCKLKLIDQKEKNNQTSSSNLKNLKQQQQNTYFPLNGIENAKQNQLLFLPHTQRELVVSKIN